MPRPPGVKDHAPRTRRKKTEQELADSRKQKNEAKRVEANLRSGMKSFLGMANNQQNNSQDKVNSDANGNQSQLALAPAPAPATGSQAATETAPAPPPERREIHLPPAGRPRAILGIDDDDSEDEEEDDNNDSDDNNNECDAESGDDDDDDEDEDCKEIANADGPMQQYIKAVHERLKEEVRVNNNVGGDSWLLRIVKENDWIIPATLAKKICKKLGLTFSLRACYCKTVVWLPDVRFNESPPCPNWCGNKSCHFHCWRNNHFGRLVVDFYRNCFVISRRCICHDCEKVAKEAKHANKKALDAAKKDSMSAESAQLMPVPKYTFMAWDKRSLDQLPDGLGEEFPAFLTHRAVVDLSIVDFMHPALNNGFTCEQIHDFLQEPATKMHGRLWKKREQDLNR